MSAQNPSRSHFRFEKAVKILSKTETDGKVLGTAYEGDYAIVISAHTGTDVNLQCRVSPESDWNNATFDGEAIVFENAGEIKVLELSRNIEFRLQTASAGAEAYIDIQPEAVS